MIYDSKVYYTSGDKKFHTKISAYHHYSTNITSGVSCHFTNQENFDTVDWTEEPIDSWEIICKNRAQQIRDTLPWFALYYSGGSDSNHILATCIKHNIKIDEIIILRDKNFNFKNSPHPCNWEIDNHAFTFLKSSNLSSKITVFEPNLDENKLRYYFSEKGIYDFNLSQNVDISTLLQVEASQKFNSVVDGSSEPRVFREGDQFFAEIWDTDNFLIRTHMNNPIHFYTDPSFPQIHIKQCHLIKNYMLENDIKNINTVEYKKLVIRLARQHSFDTLNSPFFSKRINGELFKDLKSQATYLYLKNHAPDLAREYEKILTYTNVRRIPVGHRLIRKKLS